MSNDESSEPISSPPPPPPPGGWNAGTPPPNAPPGGFGPPPGFQQGANRFCSSCGNPVAAMATQCSFCGAAARPGAFPGQRSRLVAGLLGIFVGGFGVHSFYLGDNKKGVWQIVATILSCGIGALWGFVEGIMILAGKVNTDFDGQPLAD
jgi:TM2 domain-containing membrane protein YozV